MAPIFIHENFKESLKIIRPEVCDIYNIKEIWNKPNEFIIKDMIELFKLHGPLQDRSLVSDMGSSYHIDEIFSNIVSIDDVFIWTKGQGLFRWVGLAEMINSLQVSAPEPELFKIGKVCRVCAIDKLKTLSLTSLMPYIGKHFSIVAYSDTTVSDKHITILGGGSPYKKVICVDAYNSYYSVPQCALIPTTIQNLIEYEKDTQLKLIIDQLIDSGKYDLDTLTDRYQKALKEFMDTSRQLHEKLGKDYVAEAKNILAIQMDAKNILLQNKQIVDVDYQIGKQITIWTTPLFIGKHPVGKYKIVIGLSSRTLHIFNVDIGNESTNQHPHIQNRGSCCLGERANPLRESWNRKDYITLVGGIITYLESLNPHSTFIGIDDFLARNYKVFEYSVKEKAEQEKAEKAEKAEKLKTPVDPTKIPESKLVSHIIDSPIVDFAEQILEDEDEEALNF